MRWPRAGHYSEDSLNGLRKINHDLRAHTHRKTTPWVEASTGSLGQGFSFAIGEAYGLRLQGLQSRVYVMIGDGEMQRRNMGRRNVCCSSFVR